MAKLLLPVYPDGTKFINSNIGEKRFWNVLCLLVLRLIGVYMFARWCQENFFKYMIKHFGLDMLISYFTQSMNDTQLFVNPKWRDLDKKIRSKRTALRHKRAKFGDLIYNRETTNK